MSDTKKFYRFVIPAIGSMLVTGLYFVVDGIFVGRGVGINGLAAVNIAVPFISLLTAVTMMITMGGATLTSISFGKGENSRANNYFNLSLVMVVLFALSLSTISILFPTQIARLLGASNLLLEETAAYLKYFVLFGIFFCGSATLSAFIRNDGNPQLAFWGMIVGAVSNVFLDWLFIFPLQMGLKGAAIASGLGQVLACCVLSLHFIRKKGILQIAKPYAEKGIILQILKVGMPEFVTQMSQPITILCYNYVVLNAFGEIGVSAFSVISYILVVVIGIFTGLAQGIQPLISRSAGEGNKEKERFFFREGMLLNIFLSIAIYFVMIIFGKRIISVFNGDKNLIHIAYQCILTYGICFIFAAVNIVYTTYYLATKNTKKAVWIAILRSVIFNSICIFMMPALIGVKAIWTGMVVAEFLVMLMAIFSNRKKTEFVYE